MSIVNSKIIHFFITDYKKTNIFKKIFLFTAICCTKYATICIFRTISERLFHSRKGELPLKKNLQARKSFSAPTAVSTATAERPRQNPDTDFLKKPL